MKNIFVLVTILGHLPVILSAKRKGSDNMKQILIVEDDNLLNKTLTYNLELDGYTITSVLNARTAAESLKTNIFDLVLLDINLPDGNGYDQRNVDFAARTKGCVIFSINPIGYFFPGRSYKYKVIIYH